MIEIKGKYTSAIIYTDNVEDEAISQIYSLCNHPVYKDVPLRYMPDVHCGKGTCIGTTFPVGEFLSCATIGVDIGCSVSAAIYNKPVDPETYPLLEHKIKQNIPFGFNINQKRIFDTKKFIKFMNSHMSHAHSMWPEMTYHVTVSEKYITDMCKRIGMDEGVFYKSIGSVGGGNHFCEMGIDPNDNAVWFIHCGSRNLGQKVFKYWDKIANAPISDKIIKEQINNIKQQYKNNRTEIGPAIERVRLEYAASHPMGYLSGENLKGYLTDMFFAQAYAAWNHEIIHEQIKKIMLSMYNAKEIEHIHTTHNYISPDDRIVRKGSVKSYVDEVFLIPMNMRDGVAVCVGKSNPDWNYSAPHGAGRKMSRSKAKQDISLNEFKASMEGIYSTTVDMSTIDESPMAYKDMNEILENIKDTADVLYIIKPVINIKAADVE